MYPNTIIGQPIEGESHADRNACTTDHLMTSLHLFVKNPVQAALSSHALQIITVSVSHERGATSHTESASHQSAQP